MLRLLLFLSFQAKPEMSLTGGTQEASYEPAGMESDDDDVIVVAGKKYYLDEITPELVSEMNASEKEIYIQRTQENFDY